ncbi:MAG: dihydropteroate synthase [Bacteroidales bacterium]|nr:dihydropteroate synthase [Bacteroidales bacterium]
MKNFSTTGALFSRNLSLNLRGRILDLSSPVVMGIINATPDSFYSESRITDPDHAVEVAGEMLEHGAGILDVGAVSSRPGAEYISEEEELGRLTPVVEALRNRLTDCIISLDTWRAGVAKRMVERFGIDMVNDISAGQQDPDMFGTMAELGIPYLIMHMQGTPEHMQDAPVYDHVVDDLLQFFGERIYKLRKLGINDIAVDPGFGFGKTLKQNYNLLLELDAFHMLELPLMVGISRKSMIYKALDTDQEHALNGTTAAHMAALMKGANILRVHDVKAASETVKIFQQIVNSRVRGV